MAREPGRRRRPRGVVVLLLAVALATAAVGLDRVEMARGVLPPLSAPDLKSVETWSYQLRNLRVRRVPERIDLIVVDYSKDGSEAQRFSIEEVEALKQRPGGRRRIVLAYMSIGEAENYRFYWRRYWSLLAPAWLDKENKDWRGNFPVRYWSRDWQRIIVNRQPSVLDRMIEVLFDWRRPYLDRIIEAGFDGVYLDRVDSFEDFEKDQPGAKQNMVQFVRAISDYARSQRPGFLIVPQNGEILLEVDDYSLLIDGIAKEDLLYGADGAEKPNSATEVALATAQLTIAKSQGLPVFVVEYLDDEAKRRAAAERAVDLGFPLVIAKRALNETPSSFARRAPGVTPVPAPVPAAPSTRSRRP